MAGGFGQKYNPKNKSFVKSSSNSEVLNELPSNYFENKTKTSGILIPGQSVEFNPSVPEKTNWNKEFLTNSIEIDQKLIIQRQGQELNQTVEELRLEIKKLIDITSELDNEISNVPLVNIPENNEYQLNFLDRVKRIIKNFRKNISEATTWMTAFNNKKNKQKSFWGRAKNKKSGGQQYLLSGEHSASRSAN